MLSTFLRICQTQFLSFQASVTSTRGLKATEMILKYMEKVDKPPEEKKEDDLKVITYHSVKGAGLKGIIFI